ncbi:MAG: rod shape-determining protein RodA [Treponema sp.]|nr:rod shape-determining protein RodA [Treponema sp.]
MSRGVLGRMDMRIRNLFEVDFFLLISTVVLVIVGVLFIYSSGMTSEGIMATDEYRRQMIWAFAGLIIAMAIAMLNYRKIYDLSFYLYFGTLILLLYTLIIGWTTGQGTRWIRIGTFAVQISEFAKITTIVFLAWFLDITKRNQGTFIRFLLSCAIVLVPMMMILIQPDLGTSLVFIPILLGMTFIAGLPLRYIAFLSLTIAFSGIFLVLPLWQTFIMNNAYPFLMLLVNRRIILVTCLILSMISVIGWFGYKRFAKEHFFWICFSSAVLVLALGISFAAAQILREYQVMRLIVFMYPNIDPRGSGWHIIQSITAIGSGGLSGMGFLQGTQSQLHFLPEQSTDFIFAILSEEWGFFGGILVFSLFLIVILRLIRIMLVTIDSFGANIVAGLASMYAFHFFINVGMTMGIMPITGIPLMFVSYGGSALISSMIGIGLALSVHVRRYQHSAGYGNSLF